MAAAPRTTAQIGDQIAAGPAAALLTTPVRVINIGLEGFAADLRDNGTPVTHTQWQPPAGGDEKLAALLGKLGM